MRVVNIDRREVTIDRMEVEILADTKGAPWAVQVIEVHNIIFVCTAREKNHARNAER